MKFNVLLPKREKENNGTRLRPCTIASSWEIYMVEILENHFLLFIIEENAQNHCRSRLLYTNVNT